MAIDAHPNFFDNSLLVALALTNGETTVDGLDQELVDDEIEELIAHGFLEDEFSVEWSPDSTEHSLRLRFPVGHTDLSGYTWPASLEPPSTTTP
ncbi:hypothetical protein [Mycobacterium sp. URHB0044]|uniref:hypothetical protein n=1 Tax=Mycobacterium sp. URHB0044 TaxID=1380386 RepID=UPI0012DF36B1|nr:hypothetical protein [Mycobacterium sp. URHB0044]